MIKTFKNGLKRAFTITELVIVIAVIAILAAVLIPTFSNVVSSANKSAAMQNCHSAITDYGSASAGLVVSEGNEDPDDDYFYLYMNSNIHLISEGTSNLKAVTPSETLTAGTTYNVSLSYTKDKGDTYYESSWFNHQLYVEVVPEDDEFPTTIYVSDPVEINSTYYVSVFLYQVLTGDSSEGLDGLTNFYSTAYIYTGTYFSFTSDTYKSLSASDFTVTVSESETQTYTVSYNLNYENATGSIESESGLSGFTPTKPTNPSGNTGYTFTGWYTDSECTSGNEFDFENTKVTGDITLYAKWIANYTVTFSLGNTVTGNAPEVQTVLEGETATEPTETPTDSNGTYTFVCWSTVESDAADSPQYRYNFTEAVTEDITLYAIWKNS